MKQGWELKMFGEVGSFQRGKGIQKTHFVENGMPCIHYGQIHTTFGVSTANHISEIPHDLYEQSIIASKGDVVLTLTSEDVEGSCKSTAWLGDYDVALSSDAAVFKHNLNPKFVVYYTQTKAFFIEKSKYARGFKVTHIKTSDIEKIPIPVPSIDIQNSIVSEFDAIQNIIAKYKEQLADYDALEQSIFYDMFGDPVANEKGWDVKKIFDISEKISDGPFGSNLKSEHYVENGIRVIRLQNIGVGQFVDNDKAYISESHYKTLTKYTCKSGDVIVGTLGVPNLRACKIPSEIKVSIHKADCVHIVPNINTILSDYLIALFNTPSFVDNKSNEIHGQTRGRISYGQIKEFHIPVPPLPLQQQFSDKISAIEQMKSEAKAALQEAETLFQARMDYWF